MMIRLLMLSSLLQHTGCITITIDRAYGGLQSIPHPAERDSPLENLYLLLYFPFGERSEVKVASAAVGLTEDVAVGLSCVLLATD